MARRKRRPPPRCRECKLERLPEETFHGGLCPACHDAYAKARRKRTGANVLARAKAGGLEDRDGRTFQVTVLPPKRRHRRPGKP
jgi:hypothetical protein